MKRAERRKEEGKGEAKAEAEVQVLLGVMRYFTSTTFHQCQCGAISAQN
jgi:hypothetical protein